MPLDIDQLLAMLANPNNQQTNQLRSEMNAANASNMAGLENYAPGKGISPGSGRWMDMASNMYNQNLQGFGKNVSESGDRRLAMAVPLVQQKYDWQQRNAQTDQQNMYNMFSSLLGGVGSVGGALAYKHL